jgi:hypothetical protein
VSLRRGPTFPAACGRLGLLGNGGAGSCGRYAIQEDGRIEENREKGWPPAHPQTSSKTHVAARNPPPIKTKTGNLAVPRLSHFGFSVAAPFGASDRTHRVRGVINAVCVLSPVESFLPPRLFELQFPCTPGVGVWQEYVCNFHKDEIQRDEFITTLLTSVTCGEDAGGLAILRTGLHESDRVPQTFSKSGIGRIDWKFLDSEKHAATGTDRKRESIPGFARPARGNDERG